MPLADLFDFVNTHRGRVTHPNKFADRLIEVIKETWYLGFTAFGGPPVHFQIFHRKFVDRQENKEPWLDEQTYQELFAICQALPGPGSTKFLFATVLLHSGWVCAIVTFLFWSLPGALSMFGLALGVRRISNTLPDPVYALLSGLNASTVGIVAVAAVQLAEKCIKDSLSRLLIIFGACAGLCYSALWYFPVLIIIGGVTTVIWDLWLGRKMRILKQSWTDRRRRAADETAVAETQVNLSGMALDQNMSIQQQNTVAAPQGSNPGGTLRDDARMTQRKQGVTQTSIPHSSGQALTQRQESASSPGVEDPSRGLFEISVMTGVILLVVFVASFTAVQIVRSQLSAEHRPLSLFANMYLAGTIIFGGGPVVIPLLREYVVAPGWIETRDFLIGLAIIQALPGPNFNFSVYLGALALSGMGIQNSTGMAILGAVLAFIGIFAPGLVITVAFQGFWRKLRTKPLFLALLRGINATAIGLVFTAVYRLWEVGYLTKESATGNPQGGRAGGRSLADEPWWVVVAVLTFAGNRWFKHCGTHWNYPRRFAWCQLVGCHTKMTAGAYLGA